MKTNPSYQTLGYLLFFIGALAGLLFTGLATWADFEASMFDVSNYSDTTLPTLRCPVVISPRETGAIRASFNNPTDGKLTRRVRVRVSQKVVTRMEEEFLTLPLEPGETETLTWPVNSENVVWGRLILARVYQQRNHPLPSRSSACGVIVASMFGLPGSWITGLAMAGSPILMLAGFLLWKNNRRPNLSTARRISDRELSMKALAVIIILGILTTFLGQWMLGAILVVVAVLLVLTVMAQSTLL